MDITWIHNVMKKLFLKEEVFNAVGCTYFVNAQLSYFVGHFSSGWIIFGVSFHYPKWQWDNAFQIYKHICVVSNIKYFNFTLCCRGSGGDHSKTNVFLVEKCFKNLMNFWRQIKIEIVLILGLWRRSHQNQTFPSITFCGVTH